MKKKHRELAIKIFAIIAIIGMVASTFAGTLLSIF
jgi:hypothetical protein